MARPFRAPFLSASEDAVSLTGISQPFGRLSQTLRQITHVLRTRAPLYSDCSFRARLACVRHAASVRSEPGSNSPKLKESNWFELSLAELLGSFRTFKTRLCVCSE